MASSVAAWYLRISTFISFILLLIQAVDAQPGALYPRATCLYTQVESGDGCYAIAQRCGISQSDLESYNGGSSFCSSLLPDEYVCCSSGSLPDFSPQPSSDGSCFAYTVVANDTCSSIAEAHQMTVDDIEDRNPETWGWTGCANLFIGSKICLSTGIPPFPANVPNAVCGPQANDTEPNNDPSSWAGLNPCPLNACCDVFGQCGITSEFCTEDPADTGNPGTAQPNSNGCISNCGTDIVTGSPVSNFERVGYFEAFNADRPCDHLAVSAIPDKYTIVHWAFASLSDSFVPSISPYENAWADFKAATGYKKVVSFGGWTFSTAPSSYDILRSGVTAANRQTLANNIASFVESEGIDGVDIDWEYPGAPDDEGEGIPIDSPDSAANYLEFLRLRQGALPEEASLSISLPASYYYLKAFPASNMSSVVDYFIYMTNDLHGQWDYGNSWTNPGCATGNCLRSHINQTETASALSMITKAGVPANKIMLGQALYGRSFQMSQVGCTGPECLLTGPDSGAEAGECTGTPGYLSNLEIQSIIASGRANQQFMADVASDILVYDDDNWVSWMSSSTYDTRSAWAQSLGFAGTSDWAIDLDVTGGSDGGSSGGGTSTLPTNSVGTETTAPTNSVGTQTTAPTNSVGTETTAPTNSRGTETTAPTNSVGTETTAPTNSQGSETTAPTNTRGTETTAPTNSRGTETTAPTNSVGSETAKGTETSAGTSTSGHGGSGTTATSGPVQTTLATKTSAPGGTSTTGTGGVGGATASTRG